MSEVERHHSAHRSYLDFFAASEMARFQHSTRVGGRLPVRLLKVRQDAHEDEDPAIDEMLFGLVLGGAAAARWQWGGGGKWNRTPARLPGEIGVSPYKASGLFQVDGPSQMLVVGVPVGELRRALGEDVALDFGRLHDQYAHIPQATRLCVGMWRAAGDPSPVADDAIEAAVTGLIDVLQQHSGLYARRPVGRRLSPQQLTVIDAAIADAEPVNVCVRDLALALNMPIKAFRESFLRTVGKRPHAYIVEQRIKRGMRWLGAADRSIGDIALELGFANQAHFTMAFTRQVGMAPFQYRKFLLE